MIPYMIRRYTVVLVLAPFLIFCWVVLGPRGLFEEISVTIHQPREYRDSEPQGGRINERKPPVLSWPSAYFTWLLDLDPDKKSDKAIGNWIPSGSFFGHWPFRGSGALTGDFGVSTVVERDALVRNLIGPGMAELIFLPTILIAGLMLLVAAQRWRRGLGLAWSGRRLVMPADLPVAPYAAMPALPFGLK